MSTKLEWLLRVKDLWLQEREWEWQISFLNLGNGNASRKFHSQFSGRGMRDFREQECKWKISFQIFGNGNLREFPLTPNTNFLSKWKFSLISIFRFFAQFYFIQVFWNTVRSCRHMSPKNVAFLTKKVLLLRFIPDRSILWIVWNKSL